ncbi:MAG: hypothetical protein ABII22_01890 [Candidatus Micrarchaeota archaeon]
MTRLARTALCASALAIITLFYSNPLRAKQPEIEPRQGGISCSLGMARDGGGATLVLSFKSSAGKCSVPFPTGTDTPFLVSCGESKPTIFIDKKEGKIYFANSADYLLIEFESFPDGVKPMLTTFSSSFPRQMISEEIVSGSFDAEKKEITIITGSHTWRSSIHEEGGHFYVTSLNWWPHST